MKKILICTLLCLSLLLSGCTGTEKTQSEIQKHSQVVFYFDTVVTITAYSNDPNALEGLEEECRRYENMLSKTVEGSDVWNINHAEGQRVQVNEETRGLIRKALEFSRLSDGRFDISVEPCVALWDFSETSKCELPDAEALAEAASRVDWTKIDVNDEGVLLPEGMSIDLGAIAKGYISDRIADFLQARGVESAMLNVGGNVRTLGTKPDGSDWRIGVQDPEGVRDQSIIGVATVSDGAVVTSGIYERGFELDGVVYHHILDPETGWSIQNELAGVTIVTKEACTADALSTTLFALGIEEGTEFIESLDGVDAIFVTREGDVSWTSGLNDRFSPTR